MTTTRDRSQLWVLLAAGSLSVMPGAVIIPVLGEIETQFQLNPDAAQAGWLASAHYSMVALFSPILGLLAVRIGWVRVLVGSLVLFAVFGMAGAWTSSFWPMLTTRLLLGSATGGIAAASLGILAQLYQREEDRSHAIALASSTISLANIVYPLTAGIVGSQVWQYAFFLYGISLPLAFAAAVKLPEHSRSLTDASPLGALETNKIAAIFRNTVVLRFIVTLFLTSATAYATVTNLSIYLQKQPIAASTAVIGIILASQAIGSAAISALGLKYLTRRFGAVLSIGLGFGLMAFALVAIPNLTQPGLLLPVACLFGVGLGIVMPSHYAALATITTPDLQSIVLAVGTGMTFLGQFLSPGLFNLATQSLPAALADQPTTVFYVAAALVMVMGILLVASSRNLMQTELQNRVDQRLRKGG